MSLSGLEDRKDQQNARPSHHLMVWLLDRLHWLPPMMLIFSYLLYYSQPSAYHFRPSRETSTIIILTVIMGLMAASLPRLQTRSFALFPKKHAIAITLTLSLVWFISSATADGVPLISLIRGDQSVNYLEFGFLCAIGHSMILFCTYLTIFHMRNSVKRIVLLLILLAIPVLILSRFVLLEEMFLLFIFRFLRRGPLSIGSICLLLAFAMGFGVLSEVRTPMSYLAHYWQLSGWIGRLPTVLAWAILYVTSPMINLLHFVERGYGGYMGGILTISSLLPGFMGESLLKAISTRPMSDLLYFELNTTYTFFGKYYLDAGIAGMLCSMFLLVSIYRHFIRSLDLNTRSLFVFPAMFVCFTDLIVYLPTLLLFLYLIVFCKPYVVIKGSHSHGRPV